MNENKKKAKISKIIESDIFFVYKVKSFLIDMEDNGI